MNHFLKAFLFVVSSSAMAHPVIYKGVSVGPVNVFARSLSAFPDHANCTKWHYLPSQLILAEVKQTASSRVLSYGSENLNAMTAGVRGRLKADVGPEQLEALRAKIQEKVKADKECASAGGEIDLVPVQAAIDGFAQVSLSRPTISEFEAKGTLSLSGGASSVFSVSVDNSDPTAPEFLRGLLRASQAAPIFLGYFTVKTDAIVLDIENNQVKGDKLDKHGYALPVYLQGVNDVIIKDGLFEYDGRDCAYAHYQKQRSAYPLAGILPAVRDCK